MELMVEEYKQTEVGLIPVNWEVKKLGAVVKSVSYGSSSKSKPFGGVPVLRMGNIQGGRFDFADLVYTDDPSEIAKYLLEYNDVLFNRTNTVDLVGKTAIYKGEMPAIFAGYLIRINIKKDELDPDFLNYWLNTKIAQSYGQLVLSVAVGQANINGTKLKTYPIPLPPTIAEQTAIATALSDADALISSLEKLIAKKRNIKQGAMQKLLEPKEGWEVKTLKELAKFRRGSFPQPYGLDKWYDDTNGMPFVQVYDVNDNFTLKSETKRRISKDAQDMSVFIEKGSIIITLQGSIGRIAITQYDAYVDRTLLFFESFIVPFDKYFFLLTIFQLFEMEKEKAPGGIIKTITKEALSSFTISYPDIEEQGRIATILSDMNSELSILETKLEKYRNVKLGMMQNLLTGKIRLV